MAASISNIFGDKNETESEKITINQKYATKYKRFKECQELDRLKQKYGDTIDESSSESEDEDAEALTPQIEEDFLKTLSMIKAKDPKIYKKDAVFFRRDDVDEQQQNDVKSTKKEKPLFLKDIERERLLTKGSKAYLSDSDEEEDEKSHHFIKKETEELTYNEEQEEIKKSFQAVTKRDDSDDDDDDLLKLRKKTDVEIKQEETEYQSWLKKEGKDRNALGRYWNNDKLDEDEQFLRDYILKKGYVDKDDNRLPTYNEVVGDDDNDEDEEEDDGEVDREEEFERKYNFRYEEPDQEFIKRYPRTIAESVRRNDDKRIEKRKERKERKDKEKDQKKEELKRLKKLKRKEIMAKIDKLKEITGNEKVGFLQEDMEDDFDASKYDEIMKDVFNDEYYDENDDDGEKPVFSDDDDDETGYYEENWDEWTGSYDNGEGFEPHCEDPDFVMDADYVPNDNKKKSKKQQRDELKDKKKNTSKFAQVLQKKKPIFNPDEKTFEEYFDEYYKLDFEDIIDDLPVRFKYRNVLPNNYGLSTEEVLKADDKELNEWCSLKKTMRYYTEEEEKKERERYKKKGRNKQKKMRVLHSIQEELMEEEERKKREEEDSNAVQISKPRNIKQMQKKKEKLRQLNVTSKPSFKRKTLTSKFKPKTKPSWSSNVKVDNRMKKLQKQFKGGDVTQLNKLSASRLAAYGLDKRKKKTAST